MTSAPPAVSGASRGPSLLRTIATVGLVLLWVLAIGVVIAVSTNERAGTGMQRVIIAVALGSAGLYSFLWFLTMRSVSGKIRAAVGVLALLIVGTLAGLLRIEEFDGGMQPRLVWRWAPRADELLARPSTQEVPQDVGIDLATTTPNDFPQFLGPNRDLRLPGPRLDPDWDARPPREVWKQKIGAGWSAFVAVNGYAVTQEQRGPEELVTCYAIETGELIWSSSILQRHDEKLGGPGPRATPVIDEGYVYAVGGTGVLRCLNGTNGSEVWQRDLLAETGVANDAAGIAWGRSGSPLVVGPHVIVPLGGPNGGPYVSLLACDKRTGEVAWRGGEMQIGYASPVLATLENTEQIVITLEDHVAGFDPTSGQLLWRISWPGGSTSAANASNAIPVDDQRVFVSKGYGQGAMLFRVQRDASSDTWSTAVIWEKPAVMKTKLSNAVLHQGFIYGLDDVILSCVDVETGTRKWKKGRYGYGQILLVGDTLLVMSEQGQLSAVEAAPQYRALAEYPMLEGKTWNNLCLYGNFLLVRNAQEAACYELPTVAQAAASTSEDSALP